MSVTTIQLISCISDILVDLQDQEDDTQRLIKLNSAHFLLVKLAKSLSTQRVSIEA